MGDVYGEEIAAAAAAATKEAKKLTIAGSARSGPG
jgi:hypothetical protein